MATGGLQTQGHAAFEPPGEVWGRPTATALFSGPWLFAPAERLLPQRTGGICPLEAGVGQRVGRWVDHNTPPPPPPA